MSLALRSSGLTETSGSNSVGGNEAGRMVLSVDLVRNMHLIEWSLSRSHNKWQECSTVCDIPHPCVLDGFPRHPIFYRARSVCRSHILWWLVFAWMMLNICGHSLCMMAHLVSQTIQNQSQHPVLVFDGRITYLSILVKDAINLILW